MYTIQALWSAAHHRIGAKFVICNNHGYRLLKFNLQDYWRRRGSNRISGIFSELLDLRTDLISSAWPKPWCPIASRNRLKRPGDQACWTMTGLFDRPGGRWQRPAAGGSKLAAAGNKR
jgi:hypothetical protein